MFKRMGWRFRKTAGKLTLGRARVRTSLERVWAFRLLERVVLEVRADEATMRAGAIAYHVLLSIFPLLLGLVSLLGFFLPAAGVRRAVSDALSQLLPGSGSFVQQTLNNVIQLRGSVGMISLALLLWSGSNLFGNVRRALNRAWDVPVERQFFLGKAIDFAMLAATGLLLALSVSTTTVAQYLDKAGGGFTSSALVVLGRVVAYMVAFGLFLLVYKYVPNTRTYWRWTWPGALLTATFFQAGAFAFVFYVGSFTNYQLVYGSLGSVIIFLLWTYLSALVLILGAELNSELSRMARGIKRGGTSGR